MNEGMLNMEKIKSSLLRNKILIIKHFTFEQNYMKQFFSPLSFCELQLPKEPFISIKLSTTVGNSYIV